MEGKTVWGRQSWLQICVAGFLKSGLATSMFKMGVITLLYFTDLFCCVVYSLANYRDHLSVHRHFCQTTFLSVAFPKLHNIWGSSLNQFDWSKHWYFCLFSCRCKYSHDIVDGENKKVLKTHGLTGLDENELRVLLLQNDPFLLPDVSCTDFLREAFVN